MSNFLRLSLPSVCALFVIAGCGTNFESVGSRIDPGAVGLSCIDDVSCDDGLECNLSFPGGFCTSACDSGDDCPGGTLCRAVNGGGVCVNTCIADTDCRNGYRCATVGDGAGNDYQVCEPIGGLVDPPDGSDPVPTRPNYGEPCAATTECAAAEGLSARCLPEPQGFPDGYCSASCTLGAEACGTGAACISTSIGGLCMDACADEDDCRDGYGCCNTEAGAACLPLAIFPTCEPPVDNGPTEPGGQTPPDDDGTTEPPAPDDDGGTEPSEPDTQPIVPQNGEVGATCNDDSDCDQGDQPICNDFGSDGAWCTSPCESRRNCGDGNVCLVSASLCVRLCDGEIGCGDGMECCDVGEAAICVPDGACRR